MASIYRRGKIWWGRTQKNGEDLRRSLETESERVAKERLEQWTDELKATKWGAKPKLTLNEVTAFFIVDHVATLRRTTAERYDTSIQWLDERLGSKLLISIGSADLKDFETWRRSNGVSAPTVRRDLGTLSSIFSFAIENEWAETNPVTAFLKQRRKRGLRESPPRTRYLSRAEEARLLESSVPYVADAILFAIYSGLRQEEQFSLTWDQVDLRRGQVVISAETAKGKRERTVLLLPPAIKLLERIPRHVKSSFVFHHGAATTQGRGAPRQTIGKTTKASNDGDRFNHLNRGLKRAAERANVRGLRWHDLRRTHGCRLLQEEGWRLELVRDQLGHRSVVQTEKAYAFLEVETRRAAMRTSTDPGTVEERARALAASQEPDLDPNTGEPIAAQKPAQGQRNDLKKRGKSK
jgi:integrase/recombinase XerD